MITQKTFDQLFANSHNIVIGVSGGLDSMVLMHSLAKLKTADKTWQVVYVDHQLNPDSRNWGDFVEREATKLGFEQQTIRVDVAGNNLEFAARSARYQALCSLGADTIVLAHHLNDRIETFFMKLMRGSGIKGLKGMTTTTACWLDPAIQVVRPLLNQTREQLESYALINGIEHITDPSNASNRFDRNWIRNVMWPLIQSRYAIADININKSIDLLSETFELTRELAQLDWRSAEITQNSLDLKIIKTWSQIRIKNLILHIFDHYNITSFSTGQIEHFSRELLTAGPDARNEIRVENLTLHKVGNKLMMSWENG